MRNIRGGVCASKDAEVKDEDDRLVRSCVRKLGNSQPTQLYVDTDSTM